MNKVVKISAWIIASLLTIVVLAIGLTVIFVNPEFIKKQASTWVQQHTDRTLTISGQMHWTFLHGFGLTADNVTLSNPDGFDAAPFAQAKSMTITLQVAPLLKKEIAINHILLDGLNLNLINKPDDVNNWTIQFKEQNTRNTDGEPYNRANQDRNSVQAVKVNINKLTLKNSSIHLNNQRTHTNINLANVYLYTSNLKPDQKINISLSAQLLNGNDSVKSSISLNGKFMYDNHYQILNLENVELVNAHPSQVSSTFTVYSSGKIDFSKQMFTLSKLEFNFANELSAKGYLAGSDYATNPKITGHLTSNRFNLKNLLSNLGTPLKTRQKNALQSVYIDTDIHVSPDYVIRLDKLVGSIDDIALKGNAEIALKTNTATINLQGDQINIDNYQLVSGQNRLAQAATKISKNHKTNNSNALALNGRLQFNRAQSGVLQFINLKTNFRYRTNVLELSNFSAAIFDGSTQGTVNLDFSNHDTVYRLQQSMSNIDLGTMTNAFFSSKPITGRSNITVDLVGSGTSGSNLQKSLKGNVSLSANNGVIYGIDVDYQVARVVAHLAKDNVQKPDNDQTSYNNINAQLNLGGGVINTSSLSISLPNYQIKGSGTTNLLNRALNYSIAIKPLYPLEVRTPIGNTDLSQYFIPLTIRGTIEDPSENLDFPKIVAMTIKKQASEAIKKTLENQISDKVTDKVKDLFKNRLPFGQE